jgi:hypothetical protein
MERVRQDCVSFAAGFAAGLLVLLLWPNREAANQVFLLLAASGTLIAMSAVVDWFAFGRTPTFEYGKRPARFSIPTFLCLFLGLTVFGAMRPFDAFTSYALGIPLVFAGITISNALWARSTRRTAGAMSAYDG